MILMNRFLSDLKKFIPESAEKLRNNIESDERLHREQRQEAQFVAEVYHLLREKGYDSKSLFMEYYYPQINENNEKKRLKPDLIYESDECDHVAEFKVFWEGDLYENSSKINGTAQHVVERYYDKMLLYSRLKKPITCTYLVFAYVGPMKRGKGIKFDASDFSKSISDKLKALQPVKKKSNLPIEIITG